jgi:hypothetical protein
MFDWIIFQICEIETGSGKWRNDKSLTPVFTYAPSPDSFPNGTSPAVPFTHAISIRHGTTTSGTITYGSTTASPTQSNRVQPGPTSRSDAYEWTIRPTTTCNDFRNTNIPAAHNGHGPPSAWTSGRVLCVDSFLFTLSQH